MRLLYIDVPTLPLKKSHTPSEKTFPFLLQLISYKDGFIRQKPLAQGERIHTVHRLAAAADLYKKIHRRGAPRPEGVPNEQEKIKRNASGWPCIIPYFTLLRLYPTKSRPSIFLIIIAKSESWFHIRSSALLRCSTSPRASRPKHLLLLVEAEVRNYPVIVHSGIGSAISRHFSFLCLPRSMRLRFGIFTYFRTTSKY